MQPENNYAVSYLFTDITGLPFNDVNDIGVHKPEVLGCSGVNASKPI